MSYSPPCCFGSADFLIAASADYLIAASADFLIAASADFLIATSADYLIADRYEKWIAAAQTWRPILHPILQTWHLDPCRLARVGILSQAQSF